MERSFLTRVSIENYKSIEKCSVDPRKLTVLVGRNGAGKSNFLDALRFLSDSLRDGMENALKVRGGLGEVRRRSTGHPRNFALKLDFALPHDYALPLQERALQRVAPVKQAVFAQVTEPDESSHGPNINGSYGFIVTARGPGAYIVKREELRIFTEQGEELADYTVNEGVVESASESSMPPVSATRLYLVNAAGLPVFRGVYDALSAMGFYNLSPELIRDLQSPDAGELLRREGGNLASVVGRISANQPELWERTKGYLSLIVPGIVDVGRVQVGPKETLEFKQEVAGSKHPWRFYAANMSDGTLRALGNLLAVTQLAERREPVCVVGIEEPETALHPAAAGHLMEALREATEHTQIIVTTHSPDLLDYVRLEQDQLLVVVARGGSTRIALPDSASRDSIKGHLLSAGEQLLSAGELQRQDQLAPDLEDIDRQMRLNLFENEVPG